MGLISIAPWRLDYVPTLSVSPTTTPPGSVVRVDGAGFDPRRAYELGLDGALYSTNRIGRPAKDGTFHKGMAVGSALGDHVITARRQGTTDVLASATVTVAETAPGPEPGRITAPAPSGSDDWSAVNAFLVSNAGKQIALVASASYRFDRAVGLPAGTDMDQQGAQCRANGYHAGMEVAAANVRWVDSAARTRPNWIGSHPQPGHWLGPSSGEDAHLVHVMGAVDAYFENLWGDAFQGDGWWIAYDPADGSPSQRVTIVRSRVSRNGRMGIAVNAGQDVTATDMEYEDIALHVIDCEPERSNWMQQQSLRCTFDRAEVTGYVAGGTFPPYGSSPVYIGLPAGAATPAPPYRVPIIDTVTVRGYHYAATVQLGMLTQILPDTGDFRPRNITIEGCSADRWGAGSGYAPGVVYGHDADNVIVRNNVQHQGGGPGIPPAFCSPAAWDAGGNQRLA